MIYYAMKDGENRVVDIRTDEQISNVDPDVWHEIEDGGEYIENLLDENGICRYKLVDGVITERTAEEMAEDMPKPLPDMSEIATFCKFDGLKYVADPEHPIPLTLPKSVVKNMIYIYNNVRYVAFEDTVVTEDNFNDVMVEF